MMKYTNEQIDITKKILKHITIDYPIPYELLEDILGIIEYLQNQNEERFNQLLNMDKLLIQSQEYNNKIPLTDGQIEDIWDDLEAGTFKNAVKIVRAYEKIQGIE